MIFGFLINFGLMLYSFVLPM